MNYTAAIIDDEVLNIQFVNNLLRIYCPDVQVVATAGNVEDGIAVIAKHQPQLLFLDIELHNKTCFDILNSVEKSDMQVILISAYEKYAVRAFKFPVLDYLLKPVDITELVAAVNRAKDRIKQIAAGQPPAPEPYHSECLNVYHADHIEVIPWKNIIHLNSEGRYTEIYTSDSRKIVSARLLKEYEEDLPDDRFFRIHKSHIVNREHILRYTRFMIATLVMRNGSAIPVSPAGKKILSEKMKF